jgi:glutamine amidotransferase
MCRLYGFRSNTRRKVECELIHAQNSLLSQSENDERGGSNPHGWGLGTYEGSTPKVVREPVAAYDSDEFRWESARIYTCNTLAHVRRATVGVVREENTHPFAHGSWLFAHNGNLGAFSEIRNLLLDEMTPAHRDAVRGDTDSEHFFHWVLSRAEREPDTSLVRILGKAVRQVRDWSEAAEAGAEVALNTILTNGTESVGTRFGRSLWYVERPLVHPCEICDGALHVEEGSTSPYRAVVIASEKVTQDEDWTSISDGTLFHVDRNLDLHMTSM